MNNVEDSTVNASKVPLQDADLGASKPVPLPPPVNQPLQHAVVKACKHTLDINHVPGQSNCDYCWEAYFTMRFDAAGIGQLHRMLVEEGKLGMERMLGRKFVKMFGKFLSWQMWSHQNNETAAGEVTPVEGDQLDISAEREKSI